MIYTKVLPAKANTCHFISLSCQGSGTTYLHLLSLVSITNDVLLMLIRIPPMRLRRVSCPIGVASTCHIFPAGRMPSK